MRSIRLLNTLLLAMLIASAPTSASAERARDVAQLVLQAESAAEQGRDSYAIELYRQALKKAPNDIPLHRDYQDLMRAAGFGTDVIQEYGAALKARQDSPDALFLYGRASGDPRAAKAAFQTALEKDPRHVYSKQGLGGVAAVEGRLADAASELDAAISMAADRPALQAEIYNKLANVQLAQDDFEAALASWKMAMKLDPADYHAYQNMGAALSLKGRPEEAAEQLEIAVAKAPMRGLVHVNYAYILSRLQRYEDAIAHFEAALALNPREPTAAASRDLVTLIQKGTVPVAAWAPYEEALQSQLVDPATAAQKLREVLLLAPGFAPAHMFLGLAVYADGKKDEAVKSLDKAVELAPDNVAVLLNAGSLALAEGDGAKAERLLNRAHQSDAGNHEVIVGLAAAAMAMGKPGSAETWFIKALELRPRDPMLWMQFGGAQAMAGDLKAAEAKIRKALEIAPGFIAARVSLVSLLRQDLRYDEALAELAIIEAAVPDHPDVAKERTNLESAAAARKEAAKKGGIHAAQIYLTDRAKAEQVLAALRSGRDWDVLARTHGEGPERERAGDVGYLNPKQMKPELAEALTALAVGSTTGLVPAGKGWVILKRLP